MVDALTTEFHSGTEEPQVSAVSEEAQVSAVSWAAIVAGGVASAALTLVLLAFGAGMSVSAISPWSKARPAMEPEADTDQAEYVCRFTEYVGLYADQGSRIEDFFWPLGMTCN